MSKRSTYHFIIGLLLLTLCSVRSYGQEYLESDTATAIVRGFVNSASNEFNTISTHYDSVSRPQIESIKVNLIRGELVVDYTLFSPLFRKEQNTHTYSASIELTHGGENLFIRPDMLTGNVFDQVGPHEGTKRLVVTRFSDKFVWLPDTLSVKLTVVHYFKLNDFPLCADGLPQWGAQQKLPFIMGAIGGAAFVAIGSALEVDAQKTYDKYKQATDRTTGKELHDDANSSHLWAQGLIYGGIGIIAADLTWYFVRRKRYKREKYLYETYCPQAKVTMGIDPYVDFGSVAGVNTGSIGLKMVYTFD